MCWQQFIVACAVCVITMGLCAIGDCHERFTAMFASRHARSDEVQMKASHAEQLRLRASQQPSRGSAANIAWKSTVKAQNDLCRDGVVWLTQ